MYELLHELPNDLKFSRKFKKIPGMLGFDGKYPAVQPEAKFWRFLVKNWKKSAVKHSIEKPSLLNFVSLSPTFCPRLWPSSFLCPKMSFLQYFLELVPNASLRIATNMRNLAGTLHRKWSFPQILNGKLYLLCSGIYLFKINSKNTRRIC